MTSETFVQVFHNKDGRFAAYADGDRLLYVWDGNVEAVFDRERPELLLEHVFELHNVGLTTYGDRPKRARIRSLSVGDVVGVPERGFWAVESNGWRKVDVTHEQITDKRQATSSQEVYG